MGTAWIFFFKMMQIVTAAAFRCIIFSCHQRDTLVSSIWKISFIIFFVSFVPGSIFCKVIWLVCWLLFCDFFGFFFFISSQVSSWDYYFRSMVGGFTGLNCNMRVCWFDWKFLYVSASVCIECLEVIIVQKPVSSLFNFSCTMMVQCFNNTSKLFRLLSYCLESVNSSCYNGWNSA